ncbi:hypothetical protein [Nocardioides nanhaiensis]|uniref:ABC transporter ATP-binding protein n=1 Tax=Nocardioides nanhaiensis TaxID=1476871 RepID=A0ABP8W6B9_9ACTN
MQTRLPPLLRGARRPVMRRLVTAAVTRSALAVGTALLVGALVSAQPGRTALLAGALAAAVAGTAVAVCCERVLAERLGQLYVHELRSGLVAGALGEESGPSFGITIARTTNDLTAVRTWVAQGIAPLVAAVPLGLGALLGLALLHPLLALAAALPLLVLAAVLALAAPHAYARARRLRRVRGRLAARMTDTLHAREGIAAAGGTEREQRRLEEGSLEVVEAAVARARTAGLLQGTALATAAAVAVLVAAAARTTGLGAGAVASALTIAGVLGAALSETGRLVEYRQNFRAAERILAPRLVPAAAGRPERAGRTGRTGARQVPAGRGLVRVSGLDDAGSVLVARAGDRIHLHSPDASRASAALRRLATHPERLHAVVEGHDLARVAPRERRRLVGLAAPGVPLERGTVARAVRYRRPDLPGAAARAAVDRVGLADAVATLDRGERTELRRGGAPLTPAQVALLQVARASLGEPPLLLLDHVDAALDDDGRARLRALVDHYPGVVVLASEHPARVCTTARTLTLH